MNTQLRFPSCLKGLLHYKEEYVLDQGRPRKEEKLRSSVAMVPLSDVDVASDEEEERATFEKQRLLHLSRARAVRPAHRSEELV